MYIRAILALAAAVTLVVCDDDGFSLWNWNTDYNDGYDSIDQSSYYNNLYNNYANLYNKNNYIQQNSLNNLLQSAYGSYNNHGYKTVGFPSFGDDSEENLIGGAHYNGGDSSQDNTIYNWNKPVHADSSSSQEDNDIYSVLNDLDSNSKETVGKGDSNSQIVSHSLELEPGLPSFEDGIESSMLFPDPSQASKSTCHTPLDIVIAADGSSSLTPANFNSLKKALNSLVDDLDIDDKKVHMGLLTYGNQIDKYDLDDNAAHLHALISSLKQAGGGTNLGSAINGAVDIFNKGGRRGVSKVCVVITSGHSQSTGATKAAADRARKAGIHMISLGVGGGQLNFQELLAIANQNSTDVVTAEGMDKLLEWLLNIKQRVCPTIGPTVETTTTPPPSTADTTFSTTNGCTSPMDLMVVADGSGSLGPENFHRLQQSIERLTDDMDMSDMAVHMGLVLFSQKINKVIELTGNKNNLKNSISHLNYPEGGTKISLALDRMVKAFKTSGRKNVPKVCVVITDGKSLSMSRSIDAADRARQAGIRVLTVGIGSMVSQAELEGIADSPSDAFMLAHFSQLMAKLLAINKLVCPNTYEDFFSASENLEEAAERHLPGSPPKTPGTTKPTCDKFVIKPGSTLTKVKVTQNCETTTTTTTIVYPGGPNNEKGSVHSHTSTSHSSSTHDCPLYSGCSNPSCGCACPVCQNTGNTCKKTTTTPTTPTTPTTTTSTTTPAPTKPTKNMPDICDGCKIVNGVGYKAHWSDCTKFIQCAFNADNSVRVFIKSCPHGLFWSQDMLTCTYIKDVNCRNDPCRYIPGLQRYASTSNCRGFFICSAGRSNGQCCPPKHSFDVKRGCIPNPTCNDKCGKNETFTDDVCTRAAVKNNPLVYKQKLETGEYVQMSCATGTAFNSLTCACTDHANITQHRVCKAELYIPFNGDIKDESGNHNYLQIEGVKVKDNTGYFNGKSLIRVPRFSNVEFGSTVIISLRYKADSDKTGDKKPQALIANGDCHKDSSLYIVTDDGKVDIGIRTDTSQNVSVSVPGSTSSGGWKKAFLMVDKQTLTGSVNGISYQALFTGRIITSKCALQIGRGTEFKHFKGYMDDITVYLCRPKGF